MGGCGDCRVSRKSLEVAYHQWYCGDISKRKMLRKINHVAIAVNNLREGKFYQNVLGETHKR
jgi:hypothetical protein